jgi:Protein of unknown function (DUF1570)
MREQSGIGFENTRLIDRRSLLTGALAAWVGATCRAQEPGRAEPKEDQELRAVEAIAEKKGLRSFGVTRTAHYLGIGDASDGIRLLALRDCESIAADYLDYYQRHGFKVTMPADRLTVIILTDARSRAAFNSGPPVQTSRSGRDWGRARNGRSADTGKPSPKAANRVRVAPGHYEPHTNRVVVSLHAKPTRTTAPFDSTHIAHEVTHQLTFNTGPLDRRGDVPHAIGEGLAQYGEIRKNTGRSALGQPHEANLYTLVRARRFGPPWYSLTELLTNDRLFVSAASVPLQQLAYAQAWLLIHYLMKDRSRLERFRAYLEAIRPRTDPQHRLDDAKNHLGDLGRLNQELISYFVELNKSPRES